MRIRPGTLLAIAAIGLLLAACDDSAVQREAPPEVAEPKVEAPTPPQPDPQDAAEAAPPQPLPDRNLYWGDTHLHTSYSPDAFLMQNRTADPDTAYRFAKGLPVVHPYHRARIQIGTPLDFLVVSDHAEFMGVVPKILQGDPLVTGTPTGKRYQEMAAAGREIEVFGELIAQVNGIIPVNPDLNSPEVSRTVWGEIMDAADRHDDPGSFTALMGWEWSSTPNGANLHRVIVMREGRETGDRFIPYSSLDSNKPEDLWKWLEATSQARVRTCWRSLTTPISARA